MVTDPNDNEINQLSERVKELSCLYQVASIASKRHGDLESNLIEIVNILPDAWRFPNEAVALITIDDKHYQSTEVPKYPISQTAQIIIDDQFRGRQYFAPYGVQPLQWVRMNKQIQGS